MCVSLSCRGRGQGKKGEDEGVRWARAKERKEVEIGPADGLVCSVEKRKKEGKMGRRLIWAEREENQRERRAWSGLGFSFLFLFSKIFFFSVFV
jgi:hypothetical protein